MIISWWKDLGAIAMTRDWRDKGKGGGTDTETGPPEKHPAGAAVITRANKIKTSNPNLTLPKLSD